MAIILEVVLFGLQNVAAEPDLTHVGFGLNARGPSMCDELAVLIPSLELKNVSVNDAVHQLSAASKRADPAQRGMNFIVDADAVETSRPLSLSLYNATVYDTLRNICKLGNVQAKIVGSRIHLVSMRESVDAMQQPSIDQSESHHVTVDKLQTIVIDQISFKNLDVAAAFKLLAQKTRQLDPDKRGVNFVLGYTAPTDSIQRQITLTTFNVSVADLLVLITQATNLRYFVEDGAVYFKP